jgi:hypothetical protein
MLAGFVEASLCNQAKVREVNDHINNGDVRLKDYFCDILDALSVLSEEFTAWAETCDGDQKKCRARHNLRKFVELLVRPVSEHLYEKGEYETKLDVVTSLYLDSDPETCAMLCSVVDALYELRAEIIAGAERWGMRA